LPATRPVRKKAISLKLALLAVTLLLVPVSAGCEPSLRPAETYQIEWTDADSGKLVDADGWELPFRLHNMDAPETARGARRAKCDEEIILGRAASDYAKQLTGGKRVAITAQFGRDRDGRELVTLSLESEDVTALLIAAGHAKRWDYGRENKPDWCTGK
jgi:endonuclease YncB( thermonuclease family)